LRKYNEGDGDDEVVVVVETIRIFEILEHACQQLPEFGLRRGSYQVYLPTSEDDTTASKVSSSYVSLSPLVTDPSHTPIRE
jgi:hypothetical protein